MSEAPPDGPPTGWERARRWWAGWRTWYDALVQEYGPTFVVTYLVLFFGTWFAFWMAVESGWSAEGPASLGTVGAAWVLTKATQPARIGISALLMPLFVRIRRRFRPDPTPPA